MEKIITFFGQKVKVACDEKCNKAWGNSQRPRLYPEISETRIFGLNGESVYPDGNDPLDEQEIDFDNFIFCSDDELGDAPIDPQTYEGDQAKPTNESDYGNKWCVRECERCEMSEPGKLNEPIELIDFSKRVVY
ncbi:MAG: hypothetical protein KGZ71_09800 [Desulfobulbaceae bacterium]|nr:hypothetical protein [Desulfobulbaceae bacterium]